MPTEEVILKVDASAKYRKMPVIPMQEERERECRERNWDHVLQVQHCGRIVCRDCGAEWRFQGD